MAPATTNGLSGRRCGKGMMDPITAHYRPLFDSLRYSLDASRSSVVVFTRAITVLFLKRWIVLRASPVRS